MIREVLLKASKCTDLISVLDRKLADNEFLHIVSCNSENIVISTKNKAFYDLYLSDSSFVIADGVGVVIGAQILGITSAARRTGVDTFLEILNHVHGARILLIGGFANVAARVAKIYSDKPGNKNTIVAIDNADKNDSGLINRVVGENPDIIFVAFGSPYQELWIDQNKDQLAGIISMGVGGTFDFVSGLVPRAPLFVRKAGFEWLFRLIVQPWRIVRQMKLAQYLWMVVKEKFQ